MLAQAPTGRKVPVWFVAEEGWDEAKAPARQGKRDMGPLEKSAELRKRAALGHKGRTRRHDTRGWMRWACRVAARSFAPTNNSVRTAKSCGPGAAVLAPSATRLRAVAARGQKSRSPRRARITREAIAQGMPGCLG
jgi:hypothetical protein